MIFVDHVTRREIRIDWAEHRLGCDQCNQVDLTRTATLARCCSLGSYLLREELERQFLLSSQSN
jgi:hypothetical protein